MDVHPTVLALHALLSQPPQEVVADLTPGRGYVGVHLRERVRESVVTDHSTQLLRQTHTEQIE